MADFQDVQEFANLMAQQKYLDSANRPLRLRLAHPSGISNDLLLPQQLSGSETVCGGLEYRVLCVAADAALPLKELIAVPAAIELVTDRGAMRSLCGIVTEACAGDSDGGLATYQLVIRDALAILEKRSNTRIFRNMNEVEIVLLLLDEWRQSNPIIGTTFHREVDQFFHLRSYPAREFTMQHNESDAAFIRRLLKRRGIGWYFRAGASRDSAPSSAADNLPSHTMVLFNNTEGQHPSPAGSIRYHRDHATEQRDTITAWSAVRRLQAGSISQFSWDYLNPAARHFMAATVRGAANQGSSGNLMAASLDDYLVHMPHAGNDQEDLASLGQMRVSRHALDSKCFHGEGSVRDLAVWDYFSLEGHAEIDRHPPAEREFTVTAWHIVAQNNLPTALAARVARLFARSRWHDYGVTAAGTGPDLHSAGPDSMRVQVQFTAVRRGIAIVPAYDERSDLPRPQLQSAIVCGPAGETVHCDQLGRVKVRFPATRAPDHRHAAGAGATDSDADSAWVRVASNWAGNGPGSLHQCGALGLPRVGSEVLIAFLGGDPDKPIIIGQLYNQQSHPPALSAHGELPGNRYLSGLKSQEIGGQRGNQLRFDDTPEQISVQLASDHGASQLNLGQLTHPRSAGHGQPRGAGAELRSDLALALRGAEGVLITAASRPDATGSQLDRSELIDIANGIAKLAQQLSKLAATHAADQPDGPELGQLVDRLKQLHEAGAAIIAQSAPDGLLLASGQHLALGAKGNADLVSSGDTRLAAAGALAMRAAEGVSLFSHQNGIKATAAAGKVQIQAQNDVLELLAQKVLDIISTTDWINISARQGVRIHGGGSELVLSADGIVGSTAGTHTMHATAHEALSAKSVTRQFPGFTTCPTQAQSAARTGAPDLPLD